jgi:hypothetical protein
MRVDVFNGWIELRDPDLVPERLRRPVFERSADGAKTFDENGDQVSSEVLAFFSEFNDLLAVAMVASWSFGDVVSVDTLQDLPAKTYDHIREAVAPFISKLIPNFGDDVSDPKATTEN